jgi:hypothetical protein
VRSRNIRSDGKRLRVPEPGPAFLYRAGDRLSGALLGRGRGSGTSARLGCGRTISELGPYGSGAARLAAIPAGESPANRGVQSLL